jgi:hypothetical protein
MKQNYGVATLFALLFATAAAAPLRAQQPEPPKPTNVMLTFHIIEADGFEGDDPEIRPIVAELRKLFRFHGYRLLSRSILTGTSWPSSQITQQVAPEGDDRTFNIEARLDGDGRLTRLSVQLDGHFTTNRNGVDVPDGARLITASVNLQDGKTVVLGSSRTSGRAAAIILAVTPKINP